MSRLALAQGKRVEQMRRGQERRYADRQYEKGRDDRRPRHGAETAHGPEDQGAELLIVGHEDEHADTGGGERIHGDARQQQRADQGDAFARGDPIDDDRGDQAPEESGDGQAPRPETRRYDVHHPFAQHDHRYGSKRRTARHAGQAGVGQGIAEQALHRRAA